MTDSPIPTPGALARPRPSATPAVRPAAARVRTSDPSQFGRVEDDGTVVAIGVDGTERVIGNWQAGTPAEGLAHYGVRFDDLATEVGVLEMRLQSHPGEAAAIRAKAQSHKDALPTATVIGDVPALDRQLQALIDETHTTEVAVAEKRATRRAEAIARKEQLVAEAQDIAAHSTEWKAAGNRLQEILTEWKGIRGIDRKTDDHLWKQFAKARDDFNRRRGAHFAELDRHREAARRVKEDIIERAVALQDSTDWAETSRAYKDLMDEWKAAGRSSREADNELWARFRAARDHFFDARSAVHAQRDAEFEANAAEKEALLEHYAPLIDPATDLDGARQKLRELQDKWEAIGYVPRARIREFDDRIGALEQKVSDAADEQWRRTDPAAQARAAQFTAKVEEFTRQAEQAEAKGNTAKAEQLRAQAAQWQEWADAAMSAVDSI